MKPQNNEKPIIDTLVYIQAQQAILEMIEGPDYSPGDKIPSERKLSLSLNISRTTIRKAIDNLIVKGALERKGTGGTFITIPRVYRLLDHNTSPGISEALGRKGDNAGSKLLFFELTQANKRLSDRLEIIEGENVIVIRRQRTSNNVPFCIETSYIPAQMVPGLTAADIVNTGSLYELLKERYSIEAEYAEGLLSVSPVTIHEAELLGIKKDERALVFRSVVYCKDSKPMEYLISVNHPQQVVFQTVHGEISW